MYWLHFKNIIHLYVVWNFYDVNSIVYKVYIIAWYDIKIQKLILVVIVNRFIDNIILSLAHLQNNNIYIDLNLEGPNNKNKACWKSIPKNEYFEIISCIYKIWSVHPVKCIYPQNRLYFLQFYSIEWMKKYKA